MARRTRKADPTSDALQRALSTMGAQVSILDIPKMHAAAAKMVAEGLDVNVAAHAAVTVYRCDAPKGGR